MNYDIDPYEELGLSSCISCSRELLEEMEESLLHIEEGGHKNLKNVFRVAHSIKSMAALFELKHITHFTHEFETLLSQLHDSGAGMDHDTAALLLKCHDHICELIDYLEYESELQDDALCRRSDSLIASLQLARCDGMSEAGWQ